jgi:hypothetical protein
LLGHLGQTLSADLHVDAQIMVGATVIDAS